MTVTLKDIAEKVGVSESTVSRVLNGIPKASKETREEIFRVARELNYTPNEVARSLVTKKTNTIGLIISDLSNLYFSMVADGIESVVAQNDYSLIISTTGGKEAEELKYIRIFKEKRVDGLIYISGKMPRSCEQALQDLDIPVVVVSRHIHSDLPSVHIDNVQESIKAVQYLIDLGHRNIAMISGDYKDIESGALRVKGYKKALENNNIEFNSDLVFEGDFKIDSGIEAMKEILKLKTRPTAVFVSSDEMAVGAIKTIKKAGLKVPDDISIIGFDNNIIARVSDPELTTVGQPESEIGETAMQMLHKLIQGEDVKEINVYLPCKLIKRESTAMV
ncbi:MAG TPA: LacI family DNA-binding transcriptional regulator [Halanaerobiales bacterium]|nr:LacI family DNA-binding transcriptional regulator [Halanaerobiales bacterium]